MEINRGGNDEGRFVVTGYEVMEGGGGEEDHGKKGDPQNRPQLTG